MSFRAVVLTVLIASPGDNQEARDLVERAIRSWNVDRARDSKVILLPVRWEVDAIPQLGTGGPQSVINRQIVDQADIVVGLFNSRLGTPAVRSLSGTVEELERSVARGARVHVYFSAMPIPRDVELHQLAAMNEFHVRLQRQGLIGSFVSFDHLSSQVRTALERDVSELLSTGMELDDDGVAIRPRAILRATYQYEREACRDDRGRPTVRLSRTRIEVENLGSVVADNVRVRVAPQGVGDAPINRLEELDGVQILPHSSVSCPVYLASGTAVQWLVTILWEEDGRSHREKQVVNFY